MKVEIWSDVVCPWCYIGKRRFEKALAGFEHRDDVEIEWRNFELDPNAPAEREGSIEDHLARKYRTSVEQVRAMIVQVTQTAAADGLDFHLELARSGNSLDAHRLLRLAASRAQADAMKERLFQAYFCEGLLPSDTQALAKLAGEVGLDAEEVEGVLSGVAFEAEVRADEARARNMGVGGVPFFLLDGKWAVSGAQTPELLRSALEHAWNKREPVGLDDGEATGLCDANGCELPRADQATS